MSAWPNLNLPAPHPQLDRLETAYTAELVGKMADAVRDNPHPLRTRAADGQPAVWDPAIEALLRALASNENALAALGHTSTAISLNRAVHFHVLQALSPREKVLVLQMKVAEFWRVTAGQVKDDCIEHRAPRNPTKWKQDNAKRIVDELTHNLCVALKRERLDVLRDFAADMQHRATLAKPGQRQRKKSSK